MHPCTLICSSRYDVPFKLCGRVAAVLGIVQAIIWLVFACIILDYSSPGTFLNSEDEEKEEETNTEVIPSEGTTNGSWLPWPFAHTPAHNKTRTVEFVAYDVHVVKTAPPNEPHKFNLLFNDRDDTEQYFFPEDKHYTTKSARGSSDKFKHTSSNYSTDICNKSTTDGIQKLIPLDPLTQNSKGWRSTDEYSNLFIKSTSKYDESIVPSRIGSTTVDKEYNLQYLSTEQAENLATRFAKHPNHDYILGYLVLIYGNQTTTIKDKYEPLSTQLTEKYGVTLTKMVTVHTTVSHREPDKIQLKEGEHPIDTTEHYWIQNVSRAIPVKLAGPPDKDDIVGYLILTKRNQTISKDQDLRSGYTPDSSWSRKLSNIIDVKPGGFPKKGKNILGFLILPYGNQTRPKEAKLVLNYPDPSYPVPNTTEKNRPRNLIAVKSPTNKNEIIGYLILIYGNKTREDIHLTSTKLTEKNWPGNISDTAAITPTISLKKKDEVPGNLDGNQTISKEGLYPTPPFVADATEQFWFLNFSNAIPVKPAGSPKIKNDIVGYLILTNKNQTTPRVVQGSGSPYISTTESYWSTNLSNIIEVTSEDISENKKNILGYLILPYGNQTTQNEAKLVLNYPHPSYPLINTTEKNGPRNLIAVKSPRNKDKIVGYLILIYGNETKDETYLVSTKTAEKYKWFGYYDEYQTTSKEVGYPTSPHLVTYTTEKYLLRNLSHTTPVELPKAQDDVTVYLMLTQGSETTTGETNYSELPSSVIRTTKTYKFSNLTNLIAIKSLKNPDVILGYLVLIYVNQTTTKEGSDLADRTEKYWYSDLSDAIAMKYEIEPKEDDILGYVILPYDNKTNEDQYSGPYHVDTTDINWFKNLSNLKPVKTPRNKEDVLGYILLNYGNDTTTKEQQTELSYSGTETTESSSSTEDILGYPLLIYENQTNSLETTTKFDDKNKLGHFTFFPAKFSSANVKYITPSEPYFRSVDDFDHLHAQKLWSHAQILFHPKSTLAFKQPSIDIQENPYLDANKGDTPDDWNYQRLTDNHKYSTLKTDKVVTDNELLTPTGPSDVKFRSLDDFDHEQDNKLWSYAKLLFPPKTTLTFQQSSINAKEKSYLDVKKVGITDEWAYRRYSVSKSAESDHDEVLTTRTKSSDVSSVDAFDNTNDEKWWSHAQVLFQPKTTFKQPSIHTQEAAGGWEYRKLTQNFITSSEPSDFKFRSVKDFHHLHAQKLWSHAQVLFQSKTTSHNKHTFKRPTKYTKRKFRLDFNKNKFSTPNDWEYRSSRYMPKHSRYHRGKEHRLTKYSDHRTVTEPIDTQFFRSVDDKDAQHYDKLWSHAKVLFRKKSTLHHKHKWNRKRTSKIKYETYWTPTIPINAKFTKPEEYDEDAELEKVLRNEKISFFPETHKRSLKKPPQFSKPKTYLEQTTSRFIFPKRFYNQDFIFKPKNLRSSQRIHNETSKSNSIFNTVVDYPEYVQPLTKKRKIFKREASTRSIWDKVNSLAARKSELKLKPKTAKKPKSWVIDFMENLPTIIPNFTTEDTKTKRTRRSLDASLNKTTVQEFTKENVTLERTTDSREERNVDILTNVDFTDDNNASGTANELEIWNVTSEGTIKVDNVATKQPLNNSFSNSKTVEGISTNPLLSILNQDYERTTIQPKEETINSPISTTLRDDIDDSYFPSPNPNFIVSSLDVSDQNDTETFNFSTVTTSLGNGVDEKGFNPQFRFLWGGSDNSTPEHEETSETQYSNPNKNYFFEHYTNPKQAPYFPHFAAYYVPLMVIWFIASVFLCIMIQVNRLPKPYTRLELNASIYKDVQKPLT